MIKSTGCRVAIRPGFMPTTQSRNTARSPLAETDGKTRRAPAQVLNTRVWVPDLAGDSGRWRRMGSGG